MNWCKLSKLNLENININTIRGDRDRIIQNIQDGGYVLAEVTDIGLNGNLELEIYLSEGVVRNIEFKKWLQNKKVQEESYWWCFKNKKIML